MGSGLLRDKGLSQDIVVSPKFLGGSTTVEEEQSVRISVISVNQLCEEQGLGENYTMTPVLLI